MGIAKTTCGQHRVVGYAYKYDEAARRSLLFCKGCGERDTVHETLRETVERTANEIYGDDWTPPRP